MGQDLSRTVKRLFGDETKDEDILNNTQMLLNIEPSATRIDLRSAGIDRVPKELMNYIQVNWLQLSQNAIVKIPSSIQNLTNLRTLRLFSNKIESLPPEIGLLVNLVTLDAGKNDLQILCPEICNCTSLTELNLQWNKIKELPEEIGKLSQLKTLNLYINNLASIPESIIEMKELETLDIAHNHIIVFPKEIGSLTNLTSLNIVGNGIETIPHNLAQLINLKKLDIRCNYLLDITPSICDLPIRIFQARNNKITKLPDNFGNLQSLQDCRIDTNEISYLPESFGNLQSLKILLIYENKIENIPQSFGKLNGLVELDLTDNLISDLPEEFGNLQSLETLFISKNNFKTIPSCISKLQSLLQIEFVNNNIDSINNDIFLSLHKLGKLNLNLNNISIFPKDICSLKTIVFLELASNNIKKIPKDIYKLESLKFLNLAHNEIKKIPKTICKLENLRTLYLSFNNLKDFIWDDDFKQMNFITDFVYAGNYLSSIPSFIYSLEQLKYLDLSGNNIINIDNDIKNLQNLTTLILTNNRLSFLPNELASLPLLSEIDVAGNLIEDIPSCFSEMELLHDFDISGNLLQNFPDLRSLSHLLQLKIAHNQLTSYPRINLSSWASTEGNLHAQPRKGKYISEYENLFKTKVRSSVSKRISKINDGNNSSPSNYIFSWAETRGRRPDQQDTIAIIKNLFTKNLHYIGLYDGHGGTISSEITAVTLHHIFIERLSNINSFDPEDIKPLFSQCFHILQNELAKKNVNDGTAVNVVLLMEKHIICANAGDSRSIIIRNNKSHALSFDHKPESLLERKRIEEAGGFVTESKRVNGVLALSRAIGDCDLSPPITCEPEVTITEILPEDKFLVMACDGLWDMLSNEEVAIFLSNIDTASEAVIKLRDLAYTLGSTDNISVIVVELNPIIDKE